MSKTFKQYLAEANKKNIYKVWAPEDKDRPAARQTIQLKTDNLDQAKAKLEDLIKTLPLAYVWIEDSNNRKKIWIDPKGKWRSIKN